MTRFIRKNEPSLSLKGIVFFLSLWYNTAYQILFCLNLKSDGASER